MNVIALTIDIIRYMFKINRYRIFALSSAIAYALFFMLFTGILLISNKPIPESVPVPYFKIITRIQNLDSIDYTLWIVAYPNRYTVFSMSLEAMLAITILSSLVAINVALLLYKRDLNRLYRCNCRSSKALLAGLLPGSFAAFNCCAGGLMFMIFGSSLFLTLQNIGLYFVLLGAATLIASILFTSRSIKELHIINAKARFKILG